MYEAIALLTGVALGLALRGAPRRFALLSGAAGAVVAGVTVAALSGELAESWAFALFDAAQVAVAAVCTVYAARAWRRRRAAG
jgi:membrane protein implicated in regulation of membrane protease activity